MTVAAADFANATLIFDDTDLALAHAARELREHLAMLGVGAEAGIRIELRVAGTASDGFGIRLGRTTTISGGIARGVMNGVYWLLEQLGFLWVRPGANGTRFVPGKVLEPGHYAETPLFPRRTLILGNDALHDEWRDWLEWASRNRYNCLFFHDTPPSVLDRGGVIRPETAEGIAADGKGWLFERWDADGETIVREAALRGIDLQFGGHHLPALLPRERFDEHPDWFPLRDGQRDARYNLCTSSQGAMAEVRVNARRFFQRFGGASVYHLWADDIVGGGWCDCEACAELSPSDQALRATNVLAEVLAEVSPGSTIAHLAYHDTIAPPEKFAPAANVSGLYAPRNRNYAFAIDDRACAKNSGDHFGELLGLGKTFAIQPDALAAFEYYSDAILYKWLDPPNLRVLPADAQAYRAAGVSDFGNLAVTPRPWVGPTWHAWWFARCAWSAEISAERELARFCEAAFGPDAESLAAVYLELDEAYRLLLDLGELERISRHDVLDFSDAPREALTLKANQLREAAQRMNAAVSHVPLAPDGLGAEWRQDLAVQLAFANHLSARISAWDSALAGRSAEAEQFLSFARLHLGAVTDWDRVHSKPGYANLSRGMLRSASWYTERIHRLVGDGPATGNSEQPTA